MPPVCPVEGYDRRQTIDGMVNAHQIWNRAPMDPGANPGTGDRALGAMLIVHGWIMNSGVLDAVEHLDDSQLAAAKSGYQLFGLDPIADLLSRAKAALDKGVADPVELERHSVGDIEVVVLLEDDALEELEPQLDSEYARWIPDDSVLFERFERHLLANPRDFAAV